MTSLAPQSSVVFNNAVARFRDSLTEDEKTKIRTTTMKDVEVEINKIQIDQGSAKRLHNMSRLTRFVEAMSQIEKVVTVFLNASEVVAFIWGPIKLVLVVASSHLETVNRLLDTYDEIGRVIPQLQQYESMFKHNRDGLEILELYVCDILQFHTAAMSVFRRKAWRQLASSFLKTFRVDIEPILQSLRRRKQLLEAEKVTAVLAAVQDGNRYNQEAFDTLKSLIQDLSTSIRERDAADSRRETSRGEEEMMKIRSSIKEKLNAPDFLADHDRATEQHFGGSGHWILTDSRFLEWSTGLSENLNDQFLYLHGKPGTGKSIMVSHVIESLKTASPGTPVLFFYFRHRDETKTSFTGLLQALLVQIINADPGLTQFFHEECGSKTRNEICQLSVLKHLTLQALGAQPSCYVILDGLDECGGSARQLSSTSESIISWFKKSAVPSCLDNGARIRVLFSGQRDGVLDRTLGHLPAIALDKTTSHNQDIERYTREKAATICRRLQLSESLETYIISKILAASGGMFLYAKLVLDMIADENSEEGCLQAEVEGLSWEDLDEVYARISDRVLRRQSSRNKEAAETILRWVICAARPLFWREVQTLFCIDLDNATCSFQKRRAKSCKEICGSFVDVARSHVWPEADSEVRLEIVHQTATRYLVQRHFDLPSQHVEMALFSSRYLASKPFQLDQSAMEVATAAMSGYYGLQDYTTAFWLHHLKKVAGSEGLDARLLPSPVRASVDAVLSHYSFHNQPQDCLLGEPTEDAITNLLNSGSETLGDCLPQLYNRANFIREVIEKIDLGSMDNEKRAIFDTLHGVLAFKCNRHHCLEFSSGFRDKQSRSTHMAQHERPFRCVVDSCLYAVLGFVSASDLSQHQAERHSTSVQGKDLFPSRQKTSPVVVKDLYTACKAGCRSFVKSSIERGFEGSIDKSFRSNNRGPLAVAAANGHLELCRLLIHNGAKIFNPPGYSAIQAAIDKQDTSLFRELVFEAKRSGQTPEEHANLWSLVESAYNGDCEEILSVVLRWYSHSPQQRSFSDQLYALSSTGKATGTWIRLKDRNKPYHGRNLRCIFDFMFPNADPIKSQRATWYPCLTARSSYGQSPLQHACSNASGPVVNFLLDLLEIDDIQSQNGDGDTPLHLFTEKLGHILHELKSLDMAISILRRFLENFDGCLSIINKKSQSPLHVAVATTGGESASMCQPVWDLLVEFSSADAVFEAAATSPRNATSLLKALCSVDPHLPDSADTDPSAAPTILERAINCKSNTRNVGFLLKLPAVVKSLETSWPRFRDMGASVLTQGLLVSCVKAGQLSLAKRILQDEQLKLEPDNKWVFHRHMHKFQGTELASLLESRGVYQVPKSALDS